MENQNTVINPVYVSGIALHTGARARLGILPGNPIPGLSSAELTLKGNPK